MSAITNNTPFPALMGILLDPTGVEQCVAVVKVTYDLEPGRLRVAAVQVPVHAGPAYFGTPGASSLEHDADLTLRKPATDVILHATACAPTGRLYTVLDVGFELGPLAKTLRVWGDRHWQVGQNFVTRSEPKPFEAMPITWENAYGGRTEEERFEYNPVGLGFATKLDQVHGLRLPNVEYPQQPLTAWDQRVPPAGLGPLEAASLPRRARLGTFDEAWMAKRMPLLPLDFDPRSLQCAPDDQQVVGYLRGDEPGRLANLTRPPELRFQLPGRPVRVTFDVAGTLSQQVPVLHTVSIEPERARVTLLWHAQVACLRRAHEVRGVTVESDPRSSA